MDFSPLLRPRAASPLRFASRRRPSYQPFPIRIALIVLLAAAYTALIVHYSMRHGRLIVFPTYDDVTYISDGLGRLQTFYKAGPATVLQGYRHDPPHAPYSTVVSFFAFAIFGAHDWAPYAANVLLILGYFGFADYLLKGVPLWQKLVAFLLLASFPLLSWSVQEFRPDHVSALLLAMGLIMILRRPWINSSRQHQIMAGIWCGLAVLSKPHTFASIGLLLGTALVLATLCDRFGNRLRANASQIAKSWAFCLIPAILIPLPHFLVGTHEVLSYIDENVFGARRGVWETKGTLAYHMLFYLTGSGGHAAFGGTINPSPTWPPTGIPSHLLLIMIILGVAVVRILLRGRRKEITRAGCFALLLLGAYLIPTVLKSKSNYFGLEFQTTLVLVSILALGDLLRSERLSARRIPLATVGLICMTCFAVAAWGWPPANGDFGADWVRNRRQIAYGIYDSIRDNTDYINPRVYLPCEGEMNDDLLNYLARKDGHDMIAYRLTAGADNPAISAAEFSRAQFVVSADQSSTLIANFLPEFKIQDQLNRTLKARTDYALVGRYIFRPTGSGYYLFEHIGKFFGWRLASGMGDLEGPYPENVLPPFVRWGYGPSSTISMNDHNGGHFNLNLRARNQIPGQVMTVKLDGQTLKQIPMEPSQEFKPLVIPFEAKPGPHTIEMDYSKWEQVMPRPTAVLFSSIVIREAQ